MEPNTWKKVSIPVWELTGPLTSLYFGGPAQDRFYVDDMKLVAEELDTAVEEVSEGSAVPQGYALSQNYPNPFNPVTTIAYDLPEASHATLTLYAVTGQRVATVVSAHQQAGHYQVAWDGRAFATGIYFCRLKAGEFAETKRMVLLK